MARVFTAVLDRYEGEWAVLVCDEQKLGEVLLPRELLRGVAREGEVLKLSIAKDDEETANRRRRVKSLLDKLVQKNPSQS